MKVRVSEGGPPHRLTRKIWGYVRERERESFLSQWETSFKVTKGGGGRREEEEEGTKEVTFLSSRSLSPPLPPSKRRCKGASRKNGRKARKYGTGAIEKKLMELAEIKGRLHVAKLQEKVAKKGLSPQILLDKHLEMLLVDNSMGDDYQYYYYYIPL